MALISLSAVDVEFPIYDISARSLRREILRIGGVGGIINRDAKNRVVINALKNLTLRLRTGDRVGLIGHNGAGKSTLLRVLAGIYEPVRGSIEVTGRIVSIFDVMQGMDPEATGFENIRLRGMFLGLTPREIKDRINDIVEFCELGDYLDVPMRTYSSGMAIRLAFAISTSVSPEILLLDEMIGAGDASFIHRAQERLLGLVERASLFVLASHSEDIIRRLCNRVLLLHHGSIVFDGPADQGFQTYAALSAA